MPITPSIIVHGGSGEWPEPTHEAALAGVRTAATLGWEMLTSDCPALDVVEQTTHVLEDNPIFDAGRGSYVNAAGQVELDAIIMDGATLKTGAVAALRGVANPISVARLVMEKTPHNLLVGSGAQDFANQMGISLVAEESLLVGEELDKWHAINHSSVSVLVTPGEQSGKGTVGVVVRDAQGNIAVGTSTGGTLNKLPGRVGDSPLIGCGAYADNLMGGASSTGLGESIMKVVMAKMVCDLMSAGLSATDATRKAVTRLDEDRINGWGGVIAVDQQGRVGFAFNSAHLARAFALPDGTIRAEI